MRYLDLGALQVGMGQELHTPGGRRPTAALSALLLHLNRRISVDLLLEAVWGERATASSAGTLETHIWRLRRLLEPSRPRGQAAAVLINDSGGYRLVATVDEVDSARFERLALDVVDHLSTDQPERALRAADEALALWRGRPFDEIADRPWAAGPVARLEEMRVALQERRIDAILGVGQPEQAVSELQTLLGEHPFRERLWWQRMLALYRCGRSDEALKAFRQARRTLIDEVGLEPGPELVELQQKILQRDPDLHPSRLRQRPAPTRGVEVHLPRPRTLIGRAQDEAAVVDALGSRSLVTIVGPAGCGKTLLAAEAARTAAPGFPDGVWFVDLSTAEPDTDVATVVATVLHLPVPPTAAPLQVLAGYGRDRRVLLVLDNCEQVLDQVAELCEVLTTPTSEVTLLTTSREPLGLGEEELYPLGPLPVRNGSGSPTELPAVGLFLARARPRSALGPTDLVMVLQICRAVDGIPLAIELAAALTSTYSLAEIADQVERDPGQLSAIGRGQARHHQTLAAAIERSHQLLSMEERVLHRRLSVLPGAFPRTLAEAVCGPELRSRAPGLLARLVHRSLLAVSHPDGADSEFSQLAPIRAHAAQALWRSKEIELGQQLRDAWTLDLVRNRPVTGLPEEGRWHARVLANLPTIRATLHRRMVADPGPTGIEISVHLTGFWFYLDLVDEGLRWAELAVRQAVDSSRPAAAARLALADLLLLQGRTDAAREAFDQALEELSSPDGFRPDAPADWALLADPVLIAELLLAVAAAFSAARDATAMRRALATAEAGGAIADDPYRLAAFEAMSCLAESMSAPLEVTLDRAEAAYGRAIGLENLWAAWLSCSSAASVALVRRDPALGMVWSRRLIDLQERLGARTVLQQMETFGDFLAIDERHVEAVRIFSATHQRARRAGSPWPRNLLTNELLDRSRSVLSTADFDRAWAIGPTLSRAELIAEPVPDDS